MGCISVLLGLYFFILILFSLISHPVYYCGFLVINSLISGLICYYIFGFSWYSLIFCLIYIGGVYILFVFVSVHSPNNSFNIYISVNEVFIVLCMFIFFVFGSILLYSSLFVEFSNYLCTLFEGNFYIIMCLTLLFGFALLSVVMSIKFNYYR
uniref:NADH dehydrogenase subunit 6 n=1 Tax=Rodentolepis nana TaxID=102285 RepID=A0A0U3E2U5_RODNA|nr:NADH dehydrogenase subunit 6 [Rodentolepis nana]ALT58511.1 NADH dehydrogenase subunit 6 [Rodentolepis nana]BAV82525.1 NADH dehydrogenase subunit 6 [Rodentolepis nana]BBB87207.1 NADH dehydrogenase subunit 6 [Rodentolepis nana]